MTSYIEMNRLSSKLLSDKDGNGVTHIYYWCQGCKTTHGVMIDGLHAWRYNNDPEHPTFTPSILSTSGHYIVEHKGGRCWCDYNKEHPDNPATSCYRCHTFITDGKVQFLADCSHELAGQILDLPDFLL